MKRVGLALGKGRPWAEALGASPARLDVALLPDLCQVRRIALPRLREGELRQVLRRTLSRHFPGSGVPQAFGAERVPGGVLVATAPAALLTDLEQAVRAAGWRLGSVRPAECAWAAAARSAPVLVALADRVELLTVQDGRLTAVRRLPRAQLTAERAAQMVRETLDGRSGAPLAVIGEPGDVAELRRLLEGIVAVEAHPAGLAPSALAAAFASRAGGPLLLTDEQWQACQAQRRRRARLGVAAAAAVTLFAAVGTWLAARAELDGLRTQRAAHREAVAEALALREGVSRMEERRAVLEPPGEARGWSPVLTQIADHLPRTAFLTAFRAAGDSVSLEGFAAASGPVLDSLRSAPPIASLRATAPIRRETRAGGEAIERFVLSARIVAPERPR